MTPTRFRKRPVDIMAVKLTRENMSEIHGWVGSYAYICDDPEKPVLRIQTLEGIMTAYCGDWIIQGVKGEFYPCRDDIFQQTYEAIE